MNLYLLKSKRELDYDEAAGFVVAAPTSERARRLIRPTSARGVPEECKAGVEGRDVWLDTRYSSCTKIGVAKPTMTERVILRDFHEG